MIHGKYINQGEELTDVLKVRQLSLCDAIENVRDEADELDVLAVNILVDLPVEKMKAAGTIAGTSTTDGLINGVGISTTDGLINGVGTNSIDDAGSLKTVSAGVDGKPVLYMGCGRILCDIEKFRFYIDQVGILPEFRNHGFGEFALRMLVDKANVCGAQKVWLKLPEKWVNEEAKERAVKFFTGDCVEFSDGDCAG